MQRFRHASSCGRSHTGTQTQPTQLQLPSSERLRGRQARNTPELCGVAYPGMIRRRPECQYSARRGLYTAGLACPTLSDAPLRVRSRHY